MRDDTFVCDPDDEPMPESEPESINLDQRATPYGLAILRGLNGKPMFAGLPYEQRTALRAQRKAARRRTRAARRANR